MRPIVKVSLSAHHKIVENEDLPSTLMPLSEGQLLEEHENRIRHDINHPPINITKLTEEDKGKCVNYVDYADRGFKYAWPLEGIISSWNDKFVFVRFQGPNGDYAQQTQACRPEDLYFP